MNRIHCLPGGIFACILILAAHPIAAQNRQAVEWHNTGLKEKDAQKKIEAYTKALELDSTLVEALFNLGMTYKNLQDFERSAFYLNKAYHSRPEKVPSQLRVQILFELALNHRRRGQMTGCIEALQGAKGLATDQDWRAKILFELGRSLYQIQRYDDALAAIREGENLGSKNRSYFVTLLQLVESEMELDRSYQAAESARKNGDLKQAQILLEQIHSKNPQFRDVSQKLAGLNSELEVSAGKSAAATIYDQAQKYEADGDLELAILSYEKVVEKLPGDSVAQTRLLSARQMLEQKHIQDRLEREYENGMTALGQNDLVRALMAFEKIVEIDPNFRDSSKRLKEAQSAFERESQESILARYYTDGLTAMNKGELAGALSAFEKVHRIDPGYRNVKNLIEEAEHNLREKSEAFSSAPANSAMAAPTDSLYQIALMAFAREDWKLAAATLEKLQFLQPNDPKLVFRLEEARANLMRQASARSNQDSAGISHAILTFGAIAVVVLFPIAGLMIFSPTTRARYYMLRRNYGAAAEVYEKMLERNPARVKLYRVLAQIYLTSGRKDDQAMKVFKMITRLNLATEHRNEINSIVAQNYLSEASNGVTFKVLRDPSEVDQEQ